MPTSLSHTETRYPATGGRPSKTERCDRAGRAAGAVAGLRGCGQAVAELWPSCGRAAEFPTPARAVFSDSIEPLSARARCELSTAGRRSPDQWQTDAKVAAPNVSPGKTNSEPIHSTAQRCEKDPARLGSVLKQTVCDVRKTIGSARRCQSHHQAC